MKKGLFTLLFVMFVSCYVFAAQTNMTIITNHSWEQNVADYPSLKGWDFEVSTNKTDWSPLSTLAYVPGQTSHSATIDVVLTGEAGSTVKVYCRIFAVSKNGNRTTPVIGQTSSGDYLEIILPYGDVTQPHNYKLQMNITVKTPIKGATKQVLEGVKEQQVPKK